LRVAGTQRSSAPEAEALQGLAGRRQLEPAYQVDLMHQLDAEFL
jgi:hypothetical protein